MIWIVTPKKFPVNICLGPGFPLPYLGRGQASRERRKSAIARHPGPVSGAGWTPAGIQIDQSLEVLKDRIIEQS